MRLNQKIAKPVVSADFLTQWSKSSRRRSFGLPAPDILADTDGELIFHLLNDPQNLPENGAQHANIVQIVSSRKGEGTSTIARDLALLAADRHEWRVLLIDLGPLGPDSQAEALKVRLARHHAIQAHKESRDYTGRPSLIPAMPTLEQHGGLYHIGQTGLYVTVAVSEDEAIAPGSQWSAIFAAARRGFDLVIVDSPALDSSYCSVVLAPLVDTTLITLAAESTRLGVAQNLRDRLMLAGGNIAGVILNKRRFHIPASIYSRI
ncbi:MAG: hypothetical protein PW790_10140 [Parvibaculaceae bacterium]|nr:hypothetical protein [Parvibaculaceae bacterium]